MIHYLIQLAISFGGSMAAFACWVHYDLNGWWEQRNHERAIRKGARKEKKKPVHIYSPPGNIYSDEEY